MALPRVVTATPYRKSKASDSLFVVFLRVVDDAVANRGRLRVVCESEAIADDIMNGGNNVLLTVTDEP